MAGFKEFDNDASRAVKSVCKPNGCVYARVDRNDVGTCLNKYGEEVVIDFAGEGCFSAAIQAELPCDDKLVQRVGKSPIAIDNNVSVAVILGQMTRAGFTPNSVRPLMPSEHVRDLHHGPKRGPLSYLPSP